MNDLTAALAQAMRSGSVRIINGVVGTNGKTVIAGGGHFTNYRRVGASPSAGDSVSILLSGTKPIVFTGVVAAGGATIIDGGSP